MSPSVAVPSSVGPMLTAFGPSQLHQLPSKTWRPSEALIRSHSSNTSHYTWPTWVSVHSKESSREDNLLGGMIQYGDVKSSPL